MSGTYATFVELRFSRGNVVRDSYFHDPRDATGGRGYGVDVMSWNSDHLIENNIFVKCRHSVSMEGGGNGTVIGYNYMYRDWMSDSDPSWLGDDLIFHGAHPYMNLMEGNIHQQYNADNVWGSSSHNVYFRNNSTATGDYPNTATNNIISVALGANQTTASLVGNIYGTATRQGPVQLNSSSSPSVLQCGNAYVGGSAANSACSSLALPPSMYQSSTPRWFTTSFSSVPWPAIGPDVSGSVHKIPAQLCYENTVLKGIPFDSSSCYAQ